MPCRQQMEIESFSSKAERLRPSERHRPKHKSFIKGAARCEGLALLIVKIWSSDLYISLCNMSVQYSKFKKANTNKNLSICIYNNKSPST